MKAVQDLKVGMVGGLEYQELVTEIMGVHDHLYAVVEDLTDAAYEAAKGKLHRLVAPPATLEEAIKEVKTSASKQQLQAAGRVHARSGAAWQPEIGRARHRRHHGGAARASA